jgi:hypothetical protein
MRILTTPLRLGGLAGLFCLALALTASPRNRATGYDGFVRLFHDWREFQKPRSSMVCRTTHPQPCAGSATG